MLISDDRTFIFIKPRRVAGSTLQELLKPHANIQLPQHTTAAQCQEVIGDKWNKYKKISCIRNPYDRIVSHYFRRVDEGIFEGTLKQFISCHSISLTTYGHVHINGKVDIDYWIIFERYEDTVRLLFRTFDLAQPDVIPVLKPSSKAGRAYHDFMDPDDIKEVNRLLPQEIELARKVGYRI